MNTTERGHFVQGIRDCLPTLLGYIGIGGAFGIVGASSHLSLLEIALLSLLVYAGSAQFIICALFVVHTPISIIITTTFIVNLRHFLMGLAIAPAFTSHSLRHNIAIGTLLTDETFGVAATKLTRVDKLNASWMHGLNLTAYLCWLLSSIAGAMLGQWIKDPYALGIDFALPAMFIALLIIQLHQQARSRLIHMLAVVGYTIIFMLVYSYIMPSHLAVLLSTITAATIGVLTSR
ncbi:AzlC family ABC transporter permease [Paenibacillus septentrionalis]|uniref:AzlC family ABC transporter permease n=1 Tax=Paenibacillus septentrionalis TaxID=429342 RepID=A0ABW1V3V3_9BACL